MRKVVRYSALFILASGSSCANPDREPLAGRYFIAQTEDGAPTLYFDDSKQGKVMLVPAIATGVGKGCIIACWDSCYIFSATALSGKAARHSRIGPLTVAACKQQVLQLTGDSLRIKRIDY